MVEDAIPHLITHIIQSLLLMLLLLKFNDVSGAFYAPKIDIKI